MLAVAVLGDGEDETGGEAELLVELLQLGGGFGAELGRGSGVVGFGERERLRGRGVGRRDPTDVLSYSNEKPTSRY